jgi:hypothetical protein
MRTTNKRVVPIQRQNKKETRLHNNIFVDVKMEPEKHKIIYADGTQIQLEYMNNAIMIESLDEINLMHLPYIAMSFIAKTYNLDNRQFKYVAGRFEKILEKLERGTINTHSDKTELYIKGKLEEGELEKRLDDTTTRTET